MYPIGPKEPIWDWLDIIDSLIKNSKQIDNCLCAHCVRLVWSHTHFTDLLRIERKTTIVILTPLTSMVWGPHS
jgi:hypothetical protein